MDDTNNQRRKRTRMECAFGHLTVADRLSDDGFTDGDHGARRADSLRVPISLVAGNTVPPRVDPGSVGDLKHESVATPQAQPKVTIRRRRTVETT